MKKILLATTILGMSAGFAAAEVTLGGSATLGLAQNGIANGGWTQAQVEEVAAADAYADEKVLTYTSAKLAITVSGATDGGLTYGVNFDQTLGVTYDMGDEDGFVNEDASFGTPGVFVEGSFGKLTWKTDGLDGFDGDETFDEDYDVQYDGTFGGFAVGLQADVNSGDMGAKAAYTAGAFSASGSYSAQSAAGVDDIFDAEIGYTFGAITVSATADNENSTGLKVAYAGANGFSASAKWNSGVDAEDESYDITAGYSANGLSVNLGVDNVSETNGGVAEWNVTGEYALGGGVSAVAGTNYTEDAYIGAKMEF
jgi:outer membrane protein OmpU